MTLWPSLEDSDCATNRAATSVGPPAGKGTTILIVRSGYPPAWLASTDDPILRQARSSARNVLATAGKAPDQTTSGRFDGPSARAKGIGINFGGASLATTSIKSRRLMLFPRKTRPRRPRVR